MGCDIHLYSETKKNGIWVADKADTFNPHEDADDDDPNSGYPDMVSSYNGGRNYHLFGLLNSAVRRVSKQSFEEQGFPHDTSPEIRTVYEHWDVDAHSPSWLTRLELQEKCVELLVMSSSDARDLLGYLSGLINGLPEYTDPKMQRIVFWFDN